MRKYCFLICVFVAYLLPAVAIAQTGGESTFQQVAFAATSQQQEVQQGEEEDQGDVYSLYDEEEEHESEVVEEGDHHGPPVWLVIPFVILLLMIATGPLFYEHFWHKRYPLISCILALLVVCYYLFAIHNVHGPVHALAEYVQFISLLASLYVASGGIMIRIDRKATPMANVALLLIGCVISNLIGTTGASMLLIRPFIRLNEGRIRPYHIIFFIFMVSNIGGSLTPIGDPPLFLGFLKGVPFFWTLTHNVAAWAIALVILAVIFYIIDNRHKKHELDDPEIVQPYSGKLSIVGAKNFIWLAIIIVSVFIDPNVFEWVPGIMYDGVKFSFIREIIMLSVTYLSYRFASKEAINGNEFNFEPIREVAFIFIGIFGTMMPALELVGEFAKSDAGRELISHNSLYWGTGLLSGFLDNAPTYLNFLAAAMASVDGSIQNVEEVRQFAGGGYDDSVLYLKAISIAAVFFGAVTYIGNGPNFMVKSIAEQVGIRMPSFFGYIVRYSLIILIPLYFVIWLIFFAFI